MESQDLTDLELLKSIHSFYKEPATYITKKDNILIKYLKIKEKQKYIVKEYMTNKSFFTPEQLPLSSFTEELSCQIKNGNNIILPFIDPLYDLIEEYINSDNNEIKWDDLFIQLIQNSYVNRKILIPLYAYFTELYSDVEHLSESDEKITKLTKMTHLFNLLYSYDGNEIKNAISTFCLMGTGLEILGLESFPNNIYLEIKVDFLNNNFFQYINKTDDLISTEYNHIQYSIISQYQNIGSINLKFRENSVRIIVNEQEEKKDAFIIINSNYKNLTILNNFYGEIKLIEIIMFEVLPKKDEKIIYSRTISPFPLKNNGGRLFYSLYKSPINKKQTNKNKS